MAVIKGANLALMFLLELGVLAGAAVWGFTLDAHPIVCVVAGIGAPAVFIAVWALFAAGGGKNARFPLTGAWRLLLEIVWFGGAAVLIGFAWTPGAGIVFFAVWAVNGALRLLWEQA
ncbi:YrdB family protein [Nocardia sp. NBC_00565]|uniref:YrdB family protein n=1 Tax=Nocardia sp. NBC_00565 TaxID=2975993 RepID=UPI002E8067E1|nr:YrdB family protein [Nocardia sp. NBC_00565]WUC06172.1 YrdB family protein [Nocardia sp. NBC_00565]